MAPRKVLSAISCTVAVCGGWASTSLAGNNAISYQGVLKQDGQPASGTYYLRFSLWSDAAPPDPPGEQVGSYVTKIITTTAGGLVTTALNEANEWAEALYTTTDLYLQVDVSTNGSTWVFVSRTLLTATRTAILSGGVIVTDDNLRPSGPVIDIRLTLDRNVATFEQANSLSSQDLINVNMAGLGSGIRAITTGPGAAVWASAASLGRAARFEITGATNTNPAVEVITAGPGTGLRVSSGPTVTALDVIGRSAYSGTAAFNHPTPFSVPPGSVEIANLDAAKLNGSNGAFYRNAANLTGTLLSPQLSGTYSQALTLNNIGNSFTGNGGGLIALNAGNLSTGILPDMRLSANIARLNATQTFTGANTIDNNLHVTGSVTRAYTIGTSNPVGPLAYGVVTMAGGLQAHTPNVEPVVLSSDGQGTRYDIHITGVTYSVNNFVTTVTPLLSPGGVPAFAGTTDDSADGDLVVRIHNAAGTSIQRGFNFVIYQP